MNADEEDGNRPGSTMSTTTTTLSTPYTELSQSDLFAFLDEAFSDRLMTSADAPEWTDAQPASTSTVHPFFEQPWLVSNLLSVHAHECDSGMPLLTISASVCHLIKSGQVSQDDDRARLLSDAQNTLDQAITQGQASYDVLCSMVALSEVWNLAELVQDSARTLAPDVRSLEAMAKKMEHCVQSSQAQDQIEENCYVFWCVYVYDAFEAVDMERMPYVQDIMVQFLSHRFPIRTHTSLGQWFSQLQEIASIARDVAIAFWTAKAFVCPISSEVARTLLKRLRAWSKPASISKQRDDFLQLLHSAVFVYLYTGCKERLPKLGLSSVILLKDMEVAALTAILCVFELLGKDDRSSSLTFLNQSRTAVHLVITFAIWALEHVEANAAMGSACELTALTKGADALLQAVHERFDVGTDPAIEARIAMARQLKTHVVSLCQLRETIKTNLSMSDSV